MNYKQGDIVLVLFPFTNLVGAKKRPAIVVSNSSVHKSGDFIIAQLTTQQLYGKFAVEVSNKDVTTPFKPPHDTQYVYCRKLATVAESIIEKSITRIKDKKKLSEILAAVKLVFDDEGGGPSSIGSV